MELKLNKIKGHCEHHVNFSMSRTHTQYFFTYNKIFKIYEHET